jgi:hypothetical protein
VFARAVFGSSWNRREKSEKIKRSKHRGPPEQEP